MVVPVQAPSADDAASAKSGIVVAGIWIDADACPVVIRDIVFRAGERTRIDITFVSNQAMRVPGLPNIRHIQVPQGFDVADNEIVRRCAANDLVVTQDIPLAAELIAKGCVAVSPRGELHTPENIGGRLNMRDFMDTLRASGVATGGPPALGKADKQKFANQLDRWLAQNRDV